MSDNAGVGSEQDGTLVPSRTVPQVRFTYWEEAIREPFLHKRPVTLEPPFVPFEQTLTKQSDPAPRAFRRPGSVGLIERLTEQMEKRRHVKKMAITAPNVVTVYSPKPTYYEGDRPLCELHLQIPDGYHTDPETAERFLLSLVSCKHPVSFELIGCDGQICIQFACREDDRQQVTQQLRTYFPEVSVEERERFLEKRWYAGEPVGWDGMDFGFSQEFILPLATLAESNCDPLIGVRAALGALEEGEVAVLQVLFERTYAPWKESILASAPNEEALSFLENAKELVHGAQEKTAHPLFAVKIRAACQSSSSTVGKIYPIFDELSRPLEQFSQAPHNSLKLLMKEKYYFGQPEIDLLARRTHRHGQLLNSKELVTLVHLPLGPLPQPIQPARIPQPAIPPAPAPKPVKKPKQPTVRRKESVAPKLLAEEAKASVSPPAAQQSTHGYKVRLQVKTLGEEEKELRQQAVSQILANAITRLGIESAGTDE